MRTTIEHLFGAVTIKKATCSHRSGCEGRAVAVVGRWTEEKGAGFAWVCDDHAEIVANHRLAPLARLNRTCGMDVEDRPCGALATHVSLVGYHVGDEPQLGIVSVCERHARHNKPSSGEIEDTAR